MRQVDSVEYAIREPDTSLAVSTEDLLESLDDHELMVLDVRASAEYEGFQMTAARNGHIPNAVNIEWSESLEAGENGIQLRPRTDLEHTFMGAGVTPDRRIVVYCQSGHRASHSFLTLKHLGYPSVAQYAAGWQEWGNRPDTPVVPK
jgi:thiosulfate/3-mercaptopyruvate sulfurtransferase